MLLDAKEYLFGVDGFDEIVADFASQSFVHDVLFLAFGNHDDGDLRVAFLDNLQGVDAGETGHLLVEKDQVDFMVGQFVDGLVAAVYGDDGVTFVFEKHDVGLEEVYLVVGP